jgi:hypothetical protein
VKPATNKHFFTEILADYLRLACHAHPSGILRIRFGYASLSGFVPVLPLSIAGVRLNIKIMGVVRFSISWLASWVAQMSVVKWP